MHSCKMSIQRYIHLTVFVKHSNRYICLLKQLVTTARDFWNSLPFLWHFPGYNVKFPWPIFVAIMDSNLPWQPSSPPIYLWFQDVKCSVMYMNWKFLSIINYGKKDWFSWKPNIPLSFNFYELNFPWLQEKFPHFTWPWRIFFLWPFPDLWRLCWGRYF